MFTPFTFSSSEPSALDSFFGTRKSEMPRVPAGASGSRACTRQGPRNCHEHEPGKTGQLCFGLSGQPTFESGCLTGVAAIMRQLCPTGSAAMMRQLCTTGAAAMMRQLCPITAEECLCSTEKAKSIRLKVERPFKPTNIEGSGRLEGNECNAECGPINPNQI
jgi:hypothetical protein